MGRNGSDWFTGKKVNVKPQMQVTSLSIFSNEHRKALPVNHQQECLLINGISGTFDIKSNHLGPVIKMF